MVENSNTVIPSNGFIPLLLRSQCRFVSNLCCVRLQFVTAHSCTDQYVLSLYAPYGCIPHPQHRSEHVLHLNKTIRGTKVKGSHEPTLGTRKRTSSVPKVTWKRTNLPTSGSTCASAVSLSLVSKGGSPNTN